METALDVRDQLESRLRDEEKEEKLLSSIIEFSDSQVIAFNKVKVDFFFNMENKRIFQEVMSMFDAGKTINEVSVRDYLSRNVRSFEFENINKKLTKISKCKLNDTIENAIDHLRTLHQNRIIYNEVIHQTENLFHQNEPPEKIIEHINTSLIKIEFGKEEIPISQIVDNVVDSILFEKDLKDSLKIGLHDFDHRFGGIIKDRFFVIGGESGAGKTAFLVDLIYRLCTLHASKIAIQFFSLEMSESRIMKRTISRDTGLTNQQLDGRMVSLTDDQKRMIKESGEKVKKFPIKIVYETVNPATIKLKARKFALENPGKHLIYMLDHMTLVDGATNDIRFNVIQTTAALKSLCRDLDGTVIALSQFTKEIENKENAKNYYKPDMKYLAESGRIRQDADNIILLWRPETRFATIDWNHIDNWETKNKLIYLCEKNRDGPAPSMMVYDCFIGKNLIQNLTNPFNAN